MRLFKTNKSWNSFPGNLVIANKKTSRNQSHNAIWHNKDPVPRRTLKWPISFGVPLFLSCYVSTYPLHNNSRKFPLLRLGNCDTFSHETEQTWLWWEEQGRAQQLKSGRDFPETAAEKKEGWAFHKNYKKICSLSYKQERVHSRRRATRWDGREKSQIMSRARDWGLTPSLLASRGFASRWLRVTHHRELYTSFWNR